MLFFLVIVLIIGSLISMCVAFFVAHGVQNEYVGTVTMKENKIYGNTDKYLIFVELENGETRVF